MSHISQIDLRFEDFDALRDAGKRRGLVLAPAEKFNWYGVFAGDTPESRALIANGVDPREYERCAFTLSREDAAPTSYNIGVVRQDDGSYMLRFDSWGNGQRLVEACGGINLDGLVEEYSAAVIERHWHQDGYETRREQVDGHIDVIAYQ